LAGLTLIIPATDDRATLTESTRAAAAALDPPEEVIVVRDPSGCGPAQARNAGALEGTGDVLVFVDADVVVAPDAFQLIRKAFDDDPGLVALFGSYDDDPPTAGVVASFRNLLHHHVHQSSAGEATTFWAGLGAIRKSEFLAAGGFDTERYPHASFEDVELGLRLAEAGKRIELRPEIMGSHLKQWSLAGMVRTDLLDRGVPWVSLLLRHRTMSSALNLGWRHRLSALCSLGAPLALAARRPRAALAALLGLVALNRSFYMLLLRRGGPIRALAGVGLHALHHATAVAAVPLGIVAHLREPARPAVMPELRPEPVPAEHEDPLPVEAEAAA
jgi:glycosyl transferase family 2